MKPSLQRRRFLQRLSALPLLATTSGPGTIYGAAFSDGEQPVKIQNLKTSLNAFSFNGPLSNGTMTMDDLLNFCSDTGFEAVDITAYYFPGYPHVPEDGYLYELKKKAFRLGLEISGTGVRNDFTYPDQEKRKESIRLVKDWIIAAEKIGAPVLRIFAGNQKNENRSREEVTEWVIADLSECVEFGKNHGVMLGLQNHNDFIRSAEDVSAILDAINSAWLGLILDTGSYRQGDPYEEISKSVRYAVNWQIKEKVFIEGKEVDTDMEKLMAIIRSSGYQGYLPIETLGEGDPVPKIDLLIRKVREAMRG